MAVNYPDKNNPFYTEEDDSFGFGGSSSRGVTYGASGGGSGWGDDPAEDEWGQPRRASGLDQRQDLIQNSMNRQLESTRRAVGSIYESERMGIATAEELVHQGEQLDNVERKTAQINAETKTTQRHLNSIKSVFGGIKNWWSGRSEEKEKPKEVEPDRREESSRLQKVLEQQDEGRRDLHPALRAQSEDGRGLYEDEEDLDSRFGRGPGGQTSGPGYSSQSGSGFQAEYRQQQPSSTFAEYDKQLDQNLDVMSDGMSRLKMLAHGLGDEIGRQNEQLDRLSPAVERADQNIRDQNRQMKKILGIKK